MMYIPLRGGRRLCLAFFLSLAAGLPAEQVPQAAEGTPPQPTSHPSGVDVKGGAECPFYKQRHFDLDTKQGKLLIQQKRVHLILEDKDGRRRGAEAFRRPR